MNKASIAIRVVAHNNISIDKDRLFSPTVGVDLDFYILIIG